MSVPCLFAALPVVTGLALATAWFAHPWLVGPFCFALGIVLTWWLINRWTGRLLQAAERFARGDLDMPVRATGPRQLVALADALNSMARQLDTRLMMVMQQRNEMSAVLSSMAEGVMAIDMQERVLSLNPAACELLQIQAQNAYNRTIQEVIRNAAIQDVVHQTLRQQMPQSGEASLQVQTPQSTVQRDVRLQTGLLRHASGAQFGIVVVLHDVTELRRLESLRKDFVANVSHEIRTPVSAIKAAVETILEEPACLEDAVAGRFLPVIARQADRLGAIVEDLLSLTRIESNSDPTLHTMQPMAISSVLKAAMETCHVAAMDKQMTLQLEADPSWQAMVNASLLEQALTNLIDNAIKYSPEKTPVVITATRTQGELVLSVQDQGRGIEAQHLDRVFERFYRTDRARSRSLGGTGLGLSIVKHIAEIHGGRVSLTSQPGRGSTFRIHLPDRSTAVTAIAD